MNIKRMAEMADPAGIDGRLYYIAESTPATLERFAALVLEEAAKVCDRRYMGDNNREDLEARRCAAAIRALKGANE